MDYHFVINQVEGKKRSGANFSLGKMLRSFLPVFILSMFLPALVLFVLKPPQVGFFTRADQSPTLRLWIEPANIVAPAGGFVQLDLMANFESGTTLIPSIFVQVGSPNGLTIDNPVVERKIPFKGKVVLGTVQVGAQNPGEYSLVVNKESVEIRAFDAANLQIVTQPSTVTFR